jgi:hypothetical protein
MVKSERAYPQWRKTKPVRIEARTLRQAEREIDSCEACKPDSAEIPFDFILDGLTGCDPEITDYVLAEPAHCPSCGGPVETGFWRWSSSELDGCTVFILPGTLVNLKRE